VGWKNSIVMLRRVRIRESDPWVQKYDRPANPDFVRDDRVFAPHTIRGEIHL
jgi:hypothetical protein